MATYQIQYTRGLSIEINILFDSDNSNGPNYCIINNMKDILLGEFSNSNDYRKFINKYPNPPNSNIPLYIINESFYLDKGVIDSIRKTTISFPIYSNSNDQIRKLQNNYNTFSQNPNIIQPDLLAPIFRDAFLSEYSLQDGNRAGISVITTLQALFNYPGFFILTMPGAVNPVVGTRNFHSYIKDIYYSMNTSHAIKALLEIFYDMNTNPLSNKSKYEYFLDVQLVAEIYKFINKYSNDDSRYPLNSNSKKEEIYKNYFKYVFPNKKDTSSLNDVDKDQILMFYNVFYMLQNIYLYDDTIIQVSSYGVKRGAQKTNYKKYFISNVRLLDLNENTIHFEIGQRKVTIYIKATLKPIIENPTLQINYVIDDLENPEQQFSQQFSILQPKDIDAKYSIYNKIYIHDSIKYIKNPLNIEKLYKHSLKKKYVENKEEIFLNVKTLALFPDYLTQDISGTATTESNIKFLLHKIFKFYNNRKMKNYYIKDTYVKYTDNSSNYYSITKGNIEDTSLKYLAILNVYKIYSSSLFGQAAPQVVVPGAPLVIQGAPVLPGAPLPPGAPPVVQGVVAPGAPPVIQGVPLVIPGAPVLPGVPVLPVVPAPPRPRLLYSEVASPDARLDKNKVYKIVVVFRCYLDRDGNKPTFMRKLIAENCLPRAQILDGAFSNILYRTFDLPENYLYKKLSNITKKQKVMLKNKSVNEPDKEPGKEVDKEPNKSIKKSIKQPAVKVGGNLIKKNRTRKQFSIYK
jgi:hypothetical protein